jgi:two-component system response regulator
MNFRRKILLVEDNLYDEELTIMAIQATHLNTEIDVARDGEEALSYLMGSESEEKKALPYLVLLDLKLPKINGLEVLRQIRATEKTKLLPVVILTTSKEQEDIIKGYHNGCNAYIRKPVDFGHFLEVIRTMGLFWMVYNELAYQTHTGLLESVT